MKIIQLVFFLFSSQVSNLHAQELLSIRGRVLERGTKKPLVGVNVFLLPSKLKAQTEADGTFVFEGVNTGEGQFVVNLSGYLKFEKNEDFQKTESTPSRILYIEKLNYQSYETTVYGQAKRDESVRSLTRDEFRDQPGAGGDPVKAAQILPGVNRQNSFTSRILIQGGGPDDTKYMMEGHDVPILFHFGGYASVISPEVVDRVDVFAAGYGPEYGRASGGRVGLWTRDLRTDRRHGEIFADIVNAGAFIEGPLPSGGAYFGAFRYSYVGFVLKAVASGRAGFDFAVAPAFMDLTLLHQKELKDGAKIKTTFVGSRDTLQFVLNKPNQQDPSIRGAFKTETQFYRIIPQYEKKIGADQWVRASIGVGQDSILLENGNNRFSVNSKSLTTRGEFETKPLSFYRTMLGFDNSYVWSDFNIRLPRVYSEGGVSNPFGSGSERSASGKNKIALIGLYSRNELQVPDSGWTFLPGLRYDYFKPTKENLFSPRPGVRYDFGQGFLTRLVGGYFYQVPEPQNLDSTYGNPKLKSILAKHIAFGVSQDFRKRSEGGAPLTLEAEVFYKKLERLIINSKTERYSNDGQGEVRGFQLQSRYQSPSGVGAGVFYTLSESTRWSPKDPRTPYQYDQRHILNALASYELPKNWKAGLKYRMATGKPFTPIVGAYYDSDSDVYIPTRGAIYSQRDVTTHNLDFRIDKKFIYDEEIYSLYLDLQNILNIKNPEGYRYSFNYSEREAVSGIGFFPSIGVKGEF